MDKVDNFIAKVKSTPLTGTSEKDGERGRLIFALDATASRQHTWEQAKRLQADMFTHTEGLQGLDVQLVYYRGFGECRASGWQTESLSLLRLMNKVTCEAGKTQIARVLEHAIAESKVAPVNALVLVADAMEESVDELGNLAGRLKLLGLPTFIFQEGNNPVAFNAFAAMAKLSGGAHCQFDERAATELGELLNAVAVYASGGKSALNALTHRGSNSARQLLEQLS